MFERKRRIRGRRWDKQYHNNGLNQKYGRPCHIQQHRAHARTRNASISNADRSVFSHHRFMGEIKATSAIHSFGRPERFGRDSPLQHLWHGHHTGHPSACRAPEGFALVACALSASNMSNVCVSSDGGTFSMISKLFCVSPRFRSFYSVRTLLRKTCTMRYWMSLVALVGMCKCVIRKLLGPIPERGRWDLDTAMVSFA